MTYKNNTTGEMYHGGAITRRLDNGAVVTGTPTPEMLAEWGFTPYTPPQTYEKGKEELIRLYESI